MSLIDLMQSRYSVRSYLPDPIPDEVLNEILQAGRCAPSAQNKQPWRFVVIKGEDKIKALSTHCGLIGLSNFFIRSAPLVIVACADTKKNLKINGQDYYLVDTAIAFQQMILAAWEHGVGSCWMAAFSEKVMHKWLDLPKTWRIVALSPFGYPTPQKSVHAKIVSSFARSDNRLPIEELVRYL
jgi:nitroreductase